MQHLDEGTIHAWLDGALSRDEQLLAEQHLVECAECVELVAEARGMIAGATRIVSALDGVPGGVIPPKRPAEPAVARSSVWRSLRLTPFRAGLAATVMIAVASMLAVRHDTTDKFAAPATSPQAPIVSPIAPPAASPVPVVVPATTPSLDAVKRRTVQAPVPPRGVEPTSARSETATAPAGVTAPAPAANAVRDEATRNVDSAKMKAAPAALPAPTVASEANASGAVMRARGDLAAADARLADTTKSGRAALGAVASKSAFAQTAASAPMRLAEVVATSTSTSTAGVFIGCYGILRDSAASPTQISERFGLDQVGTPVARNVVRAIAASGAMDTVLTYATWQSTSRGVATVMWNVGSVPEVLRVAFGSAGLTATKTVDGRSHPVSVVKVICSR